MKLQDLPIWFIPDSSTMGLGLLFLPPLGFGLLILAFVRFIRKPPRPWTLFIYFICAFVALGIAFLALGEEFFLLALTGMIVAAALSTVETLIRGLWPHLLTTTCALFVCASIYFYLVCALACSGI